MINASASKNKYVVSTMVLTMELIKLFIVLTLLLTVKLRFSLRKTVQLLYNEILCRPIDTFPLAVPSFLYVLQDNLIIYALSCVDAATYQVIKADELNTTTKIPIGDKICFPHPIDIFLKVTYQARVLTTALFARILLNQVLPMKSWLSLVLLMLGVILTQASTSIISEISIKRKFHFICI